MLSDPDGVASLEAGSKLDSYELLGIVARGGMANVWLARQRMKHDLEMMVAIKTILPELSLDPAFQAMFLDEARIACRVDHPNVARLLGVGEAAGHSFIVMEYVAGESLSRLRKTLVREGQAMPLEVVLRVASDLCGALHAVHELLDAEGNPLHVVHRDVSPQNVLLSDTGIVKLIDFGVAKARDRFAAETSAGFAKGKPRYMAPEQACGAPVNRRADVWGVGALLHELISGRTPFDGENDAAVFRQLMGADVVPRLPDSVPAPLRAVIDRALTRDPDGRYPTARAMRDAIEDAASALGLRATAQAVERLCADTLAKRIADRKREVEGWVRAANVRAGDPTSMSLKAMTSARTPPVAPEDRSVSSLTSDPGARPSRRSRGTLFAVAGVALLMGLVGGVKVLRTAQVATASAVASPSVSAAVSAAAAAPPPASASAPASAPAPASASAPAPASSSKSKTHPRPTAAPARDWGGIQ